MESKSEKENIEEIKEESKEKSENKMPESLEDLVKVLKSRSKNIESVFLHSFRTRVQY